MVLYRTVGKTIGLISNRFGKYEKTKEYRHVEHNARKQEELEKMREDFQERMQERQERFQQKLHQENADLQRELAKFNQLSSRQTQMILAEYNTYFGLRHTLIQDAIRNFPLNISPLVLLENNNIDIAFLLGGDNQDLQLLQAMNESVYKQKPISVFITPIHVDSRVNGKELLAAQVFDNVYSSLESLFVNEYARTSERPVIFYPTAWNKNVRGGLHAAEELYYFLNGLPTIVVEPRFDGTCLKIMFSCWGLGYSEKMHFRQEIPIEMDWNALLATKIYERSKMALETYSKVEGENAMILNQRKACLHNVNTFEALNLGVRLEKRFNEIKETGASKELNELGDYSQLFYVSPNDVGMIADMVSSSIGMLVASMSDIHHLIASDVNPRLPAIYNKYFGQYLDNDCGQSLKQSLFKLYKNIYYQLEMEDQKLERELQLLCVQSQLEQKRITESSEDEMQRKLLSILKQKVNELGAGKETENWNLDKCLTYYINNMSLDDDKFRESITPLLTKEWNMELYAKVMALKK